MPEAKYNTFSPDHNPFIVSNVPESMRQINQRFTESHGAMTTSDTFDTSESNSFSPIMYEGVEFGYFVNLPKTKNKEVSEQKFNNVVYAQNFGNANDCCAGFDLDSERSTRLWTLQAEKTVSEIKTLKPEISTLNDVAITQRLIDELGPNYYMYFTPCWNSDEWLTTYSVIMVAKRDGIEPADQVKFVGDYGRAELVEKFDNKDRYNTSTFGMSLIELRKQLNNNVEQSTWVGVKYGSCFTTTAQRMATVAAQVGGVNYLKNCDQQAKFIICGDSNHYNIDSSEGNGPKNFLPIIAKKVLTAGRYNSNQEIGRVNKILRGSGLEYLIPRNLNNIIQTTFNGVGKLEIDDAKGVNKQILNLKNFVTQNLIGLSLDNGYTNMRNLEISKIKNGLDHDGLYIFRKNGEPLI